MMNQASVSTHWEPRVMRHRLPSGREEYAIHEVYFEGGIPSGCTKDALSPRAPTIGALRDRLRHLIACGSREFVLGDRGLRYDRASLQSWLVTLEQEPIDYDGW